MNKIELLFKDAIRQSFKPKSRLKLWEWCESFIRLQSKTSGTFGKYSLKNYHYLKDIYDSIEDDKVRKVVILKSTQSGLTTLAQNVILWYVCNHNVPITYFTSTQDLARKFSKRTLQPTIEKCEPLQELRPKNQEEETNLYFEFLNCIVKLGWAGSLNSLASDPACLVILDEVSKWKNDKAEAKSYELALQRTNTFPLDKKQILLSTPTEESVCVINQEYKLGDERVYKVRSPYTNELFEITVDLLKKPIEYQDAEGNYDWIKIKKGTWLEDPTTRVYDSEGRVTVIGKPIQEHQKAELVRNGEWIATNLNPKDPECHSYKVTALYSMDESWGNLLVMFIQAQDDVNKLKKLRTQYLGQTWKQVAASIRVEQVDALIKNSPHYPIGVVPEYLGEDGMLLGACDQQLDCFYFVIVALCSSGKSYLIDYGKIMSGVDSLAELGKKTYKTIDDKEEYGVNVFLVDEGGFTADPLREFSVQSGFQFVCCKGVTDATGAPYKNTIIRHRGADIPYVHINDHEMKNILLLQTIAKGMNDLYLPFNTDEEFKRQLCNEEILINGRGMPEWKAKGMNHYLDCMKYAEALRHYNKQFLKVNTVEIELAAA
jgi:phage terminase large subunit GpA-like protein